MCLAISGRVPPKSTRRRALDAEKPERVWLAFEHKDQKVPERISEGSSARLELILPAVGRIGQQMRSFINFCNILVIIGHLWRVLGEARLLLAYIRGSNVCVCVCVCVCVRLCGSCMYMRVRVCLCAK